MPRLNAGVENARNPYGPQARTILKSMNLPIPMRPDFEVLGSANLLKVFFGLVKKEHSVGSLEYRLISSACDTSEYWHNKKGKRRLSGVREFKRSLRATIILWVYCGVRSAVRIAAMLPHDLYELYRKRWSRKQIEKRFGPEVAKHVAELTKPPLSPGTTDEEVERVYYGQQLSSASREVVEEKGCDVLDNLMTLWKRNFRSAMRKINDVRRYLLPLLRKHGLTKLLNAIEMVIAFILEKNERKKKITI